MKKLLSMVLIIFISLGLFACGESSGEPKCVHSESDWIVATEPTCTTAGLKILSCEKCGEQTRIIPAIGHNWINASCTTPKTCDNCNAIDGNALGHSYASKVDKEPTCTQEGKEIYTYPICNDSYEQIIQPKGHSYKLQESGEDICLICDDEAYVTYSSLALTKIYQSLKDPSSAEILSIYAGKYNYKEENYIVVVISLRAKNSYGGMVSGEYVSLINLNKNEVIYDMEGYAESQAEYYKSMADRSIGNEKITYLEKRGEYLSMAQDARIIISKKAVLFISQKIDYIIKISNITAKIS